MTESVQKWLLRNRPPRVKITYDAHTGGTLEKRELPFIVGIFADLSGYRSADPPIPPLKARAMVPIDRDSFDEVMGKLAPRVELHAVPLTLQTPPGSTMITLSGALQFRSLEDFEPAQVVQNIPDLDHLFGVRGHLRTLESRSEANDLLADRLDGLFANGPAAATQRDALQLLARPANADAASLAAAKLRLFQLCGALALADPDQVDPAASSSSPGKELAAWGVAPLQVGNRNDLAATTVTVRQLMEALAPPDDAEQLALARQQLLDLSGLANWGSANPDEPALRKQLRDAFGAGLNPQATDLATLAAALGAGLDSPVTPTTKGWTTENLRLAARLLRGLQRADDPRKVGTDGTARALKERKHEAHNRWFANNLLLRLSGAPAAGAGGGDGAGGAGAAAGGGGTPPMPAPASSNTWARMVSLSDWLPLAASTSDRQALDALGPLGYFQSEVLAPLFAAGSPSMSMSSGTAIAEWVAEIDEAIQQQLNEVMHAPRFREVEATWRGLHYLVSRAETGEMLKLLVFNARADELLDDMERAVELDQSRLLKLIYEAEYGTYGGHPFSLLVGGYELGRSPQDTKFLRKIAEIAAAAHAPFIAAAAPSLFGLSSFRELDRPRDLAKIFESAEAAGWREFRDTEDSRYVSLVLPHVLLRLPYGRDTLPARGIAFEEDVGKGPSSERFLWGNAAYLMAERITNAFALYHWTAAIRGVEGGGLIEGLPIYTYTNGDDARTLFCPTEVSITDPREKELIDLGFISLCHCKGAGKAAFFSGQITNRPKRYITDDANANALISARLPYMLAASRFAHYIKVMMREKIGSFLTRNNVESMLNNWIAQYVLLDENATQEAKAAYPLSQATIVVTDVPGQPGAYIATLFLRPHFQLEELTTSIRLVANLPTA